MIHPTQPPCTKAFVCLTFYGLAKQVLKLARSGGVVVRSRELRAQARKVRVEEYFYGFNKASNGRGIVRLWRACC